MLANYHEAPANPRQRALRASRRDFGSAREVVEQHVLADANPRHLAELTSLVNATRYPPELANRGSAVEIECLPSHVVRRARCEVQRQ